MRLLDFIDPQCGNSHVTVKCKSNVGKYRKEWAGKIYTDLRKNSTKNKKKLNIL